MHKVYQQASGVTKKICSQNSGLKNWRRETPFGIIKPDESNKKLIALLKINK
jgi:hypothetical protein